MVIFYDESCDGPDRTQNLLCKLIKKVLIFTKNMYIIQIGTDKVLFIIYDESCDGSDRTVK